MSKSLVKAAIKNALKNKEYNTDELVELLLNSSEETLNRIIPTEDVVNSPIMRHEFVKSFYEMESDEARQAAVEYTSDKTGERFVFLYDSEQCCFDLFKVY